MGVFASGATAKLSAAAMAKTSLILIVPLLEVRAGEPAPGPLRTRRQRQPPGTDGGAR
jgi:hypothetical protein